MYFFILLLLFRHRCFDLLICEFREREKNATVNHLHYEKRIRKRKMQTTVENECDDLMAAFQVNFIWHFNS